MKCSLITSLKLCEILRKNGAKKAEELKLKEK